ncbi:MAG: CsbD family protein [Ornithinibacter sp.]
MGAGDRVDNAMQNAGGKTKEAMGGATGDESQQADGKEDQVSADLKNAGEDVKDAFKH